MEIKDMNVKNKNSLYPECWDDDVRMGVLFSQFRPRSVNPENYESKLNFWKRMIRKYCEIKGCAKFRKTELLMSFQRNEKSPYGLDHVLENMIQKGELKTSIKFHEDIGDGWSIWALKTFIKKPIVWGLQKAIGTAIENQDPSYVHIDLVHQQSLDLVAALQKLNRNLISNEELSDLQDVNLNQEGKDLCLQYLHSLGKVYVEYQVQNGEKRISVIKVPKGIQPASPPTDLEWALFSLENTQRKLDKCIENLHTDMKNSEDAARSYVREGKKALAKASLRRKHITEKNLEKRIIARDNIQILLTNLEDAQDNKVVLNAIKMGSDTLKSLLKKSDLSLDNIDEVISEVKENLDWNDEVQRTLSEPIKDDTFDESTLDEELNEILSRPEENLEIIKPNEKETQKIKEKNKELDSKEEKELLEHLEKLEIESTSVDLERPTTPATLP